MSPKKRSKRQTGPRDRYPDDLYLREEIGREEIGDEQRLLADPEWLTRRNPQANNAMFWTTALGVVVLAGLVLYGASQYESANQMATGTAQETTGQASGEAVTAPEGGDARR